MLRKTISLPIDIHDLISLIKEEYEGETQQKHTYPSIIFMLCQYYLNKENDAPLNEEGKVKKELKETNEFIKEAFMKMIDNQKLQPMYVVANNSEVPVTLINENNPPKKSLTEEQIQKLRKEYESTGKQFVEEMDDIISETGGLSPSIVAQINPLKDIEESPEAYKKRREQERKKLEKDKKKLEKKIPVVPEGLTPPP